MSDVTNRMTMGDILISPTTVTGSLKPCGHVPGGLVATYVCRDVYCNGTRRKVS